MALELKDVVAKIKSVTPRIRGGGEGELGAIVRLQLELTADDVLPCFHDSLNHFLFSNEGLRFKGAMESFNWKSTMKDMQLELAGLHFEQVDIGKFFITPFIEKVAQLPLLDDIEPETKPLDINKVRLSMNAGMLLNCGSDLGVLALLINREVPMSVSPM